MAVSVTVTAVKIDVTSTGGALVTMSDIVTAVGDTAVMEEVGTVITIKRAAGQVYREFEISAGCKVEYEEDYTINHEGISNTSTYTQLEWASGSYVKLNPGVTIDMNSDNQTYARSYLYAYGEVEAVGTLAKPITLKKMRNFYLAAAYDQEYEYVYFQDWTYLTSFCLSLGYQVISNTAPQVSLKHCRVENTNANYFGYGMYSTSGNRTLDNFTIEDCVFTHLYYPLYMTTTAGGMKFTRCEWSDCPIQPVIYGAGGYGLSEIGSTNIGSGFKQNTHQGYFYFDECTFDDVDNGVYGAYLLFNTNAILKNCTIKNQSYGITSQYGSKVYELGTTTFDTVTTARAYAYQGGTFPSYELGITVRDLAGSPVDDAIVEIRQNDGYATWHVSTDSNGEVLGAYGDKTVLPERGYYGVTSFEDWSEYTVTVTKQGYCTEFVSVTSDADKDIIVTLTPINTGATVINDAVINNSVIN